MSEETAISRQIEHIEWGKMTVAGIGEGRDFMLYPGGGRDWDWNQSDTHHVPGIQPIDVQLLLDNGATVVVLSRGMHLRLQTDPRTIALLENAGVAYHIEETNAAVALYNRLAAAGERVGGLFHSTC